MRENLIGQQFERLIVVGRGENNKGGKSMWICQCDCGNLCKKPKTGYDLKAGKVKSCGCFKKEVVAKTGKANAIHNMTDTRLWKIWSCMKQRCYYPRGTPYNNYGGRGIAICKEWRRSFVPFKDWAIKNGYKDNLTIDRKDNDGNYEPNNCRWATYLVQENNRGNNKIIEISGRRDTVSIMARENNLSPSCLNHRIINGWDKRDWFMRPNLNNKNIRKRRIKIREQNNAYGEIR